MPKFERKRCTGVFDGGEVCGRRGNYTARENISFKLANGACYDRRARTTFFPREKSRGLGVPRKSCKEKWHIYIFFFSDDFGS